MLDGCSALRHYGAAFVFLASSIQHTLRVTIAFSCASARTCVASALRSSGVGVIGFTCHGRRSKNSSRQAGCYLDLDHEPRHAHRPVTVTWHGSVCNACARAVVHNEFDTRELALTALRAAGREVAGFWKIP